MLVRILTDNPGETFTRNLGGEFPERCRKLLKHVREKRVHRMLMETLDDFERSRSWDENLRPLIEMWKAQKDAAYEDYAKVHLPPSSHPGALVEHVLMLTEHRQTHGRIPAALQQQQQQQFFQQAAFSPIPMNPHSQNYFARAPQFNGSAGTSTQNNASRAKRLPDPVELTSRLEEARTSAKLLEQVVINTPPAEVLDNELIKEFADRCQSASRSIQGYMQSDDPVPDNDTMESLIDTNEQLQTALNQHQRTVLNARKQMGVNEPESNQGAFSSGALSGFDNGNNSNNEWPNASSTNTTSSNQAELLPELGSSSSYAGNGKGKEATNGSGSGSGSGAAYGVYSGSAGPSGSAVSGTHGSGSNELDPFADPPQSDEPRTHHDPFDRPFASSSSAAPAASATDGGADKIVALDRDDYGKGPAYRY